MTAEIKTTHRRKGGVIVKAVFPESLAQECGIEPGDKIFAINGHIIPDSLSYAFNINHSELLMVLDKADGERWELDIEKEPDEPFGVALEEDPIMLCRNKCIFCFVDQNPKGYRKSLLIKDEDIRLSFMYGNYSTLSSTDAGETERIIREKISPLYISVHATDPDVRTFMLKNKRSGNILDRLRHFAQNDISFHCQIVLCPEVNDGAILDQTLNELASLYPRTLSIAVVPLGITAYRQGITQLKPVSDEYCRTTIERLHQYRQHFNETLGYPLVFLGDEFYLRAGQPVPPIEEYRNFPQMENGIGMVRRFIDDFSLRVGRGRAKKMRHSGTLVTGSLFAPILSQLMQDFNETNQTHFQVAGIRNDAFGAGLISVAGLVHGQDIIRQLKEKDLGQYIFIPEVMLKSPEDPILIDNLTLQDLATELHTPIITCGNEAPYLLDVLEKGTSSDVIIYP